MICCTYTVERYGRRPLLLISLVVISIVDVLMFVVVITFTYTQQQWLGTFASCTINDVSRALNK